MDQALTHPGDTHHAAGDLERAGRAWQQAAHILDELGHPDAETVHTRLARLYAAAARTRTGAAPGLVLTVGSRPVPAAAGRTRRRDG